jgi:hypothetical protein
MATAKRFLLAIVLNGAIAASGLAQAEQAAKTAPPGDGAGLFYQFGLAKRSGSFGVRDEDTYMASNDLGYLGRISDGHQLGMALQVAMVSEDMGGFPFGPRFIYRRVFGLQKQLYAELSPGLYLSTLTADAGALTHPAWFCSAEIGHRSLLAVSLRYDPAGPYSQMRRMPWAGSWSLGVKIPGWKGLVTALALIVIAAATFESVNMGY